MIFLTSSRYLLNLKCTEKIKFGDLKSQGYSLCNFYTPRSRQAAYCACTATLQVCDRSILFKIAELVSKPQVLCFFFCIILTSINFTVFISCFTHIEVSFNLYLWHMTTYWNAACCTWNIWEWYWRRKVPSNKCMLSVHAFL